MKKTILCIITLVFLASCATANAKSGSKTFGTIDAIAVEESTFTVKGDDGTMYLFNVNEATEMERSGTWFDQDIDITDLNTGERVKVEFIATNPSYLIVEEVEVYPPRKK